MEIMVNMVNQSIVMESQERILTFLFLLVLRYMKSNLGKVQRESPRLALHFLFKLLLMNLSLRLLI